MKDFVLKDCAHCGSKACEGPRMGRSWTVKCLSLRCGVKVVRGGPDGRTLHKCKAAARRVWNQRVAHAFLLKEGSLASTVDLSRVLKFKTLDGKVIGVDGTRYLRSTGMVDCQGQEIYEGDMLMRAVQPSCGIWSDQGFPRRAIFSRHSWNFSQESAATLRIVPESKAKKKKL